MAIMKRTRVLRLVLLGGGLVAMTACGDSSPPGNDQTLRFACEQAKQQNLTNAQEICQRAATATSSGSTSGTHYTGSGYRSSGGGWLFPWFFGRSYGANDRSYTGSWFSGRSSSSTSGFTGSSSASSSACARGGFGTTASSAGS